MGPIQRSIHLMLCFRGSVILSATCRNASPFLLSPFSSLWPPFGLLAVEVPVDVPGLRQRLQTLQDQEKVQIGRWEPIVADLKRLFSSAETLSTSFLTVPTAAGEVCRAHMCSALLGLSYRATMPFMGLVYV